MTKVLVTSPLGKEKLIQAFQSQEVEVVSELMAGVKLIVPTVDEELWFFSRSLHWFKGIKILTSNSKAVDTCRDKAEFYKFCKANNFGVPETTQFDAIVKPRFGKGGRGIQRFDRTYVVQEVVNCPEYSIDYFKDKETLSVIARKRLNVVNGESTEAEFTDDIFLIEEAKRLGDALKLEGHNVMQCFYDGSKIKWLEVNCRYGGGSWLSFDKFNSPAHLVKQYC